MSCGVRRLFSSLLQCARGLVAPRCVRTSGGVRCGRGWCNRNEYGREVIRRMSRVHCGISRDICVVIAEDRFELCDARIRNEIQRILRDLGFVYTGRTYDDQACFVDLKRFAREFKGSAPALSR